MIGVVGGRKKLKSKKKVTVVKYLSSLLRDGVVLEGASIRGWEEGVDLYVLKVVPSDTIVIVGDDTKISIRDDEMVRGEEDVMEHIEVDCDDEKVSIQRPILAGLDGPLENLLEILLLSLEMPKELMKYGIDSPTKGILLR